jgi:hypothetical protein
VNLIFISSKGIDKRIKEKKLVHKLISILLCISILMLLCSAIKQTQGDLPSRNTDMVGLVPYFRQSGDTCGLYSMKMVLWWFGITSVFTDDIANFLGKDEGPHYLWELDDAFDHFMPSGSWHTYGGFDDAAEAKNWVKQRINQGIPVICCIQAPGSHTLGWANHYVVIVGYNEGGWYLHDPGGWPDLANPHSWDSYASYEWFDNYWDKWWTASLGSNDNRGVVAACLPGGTSGVAQPQVSLRTEGSTKLENIGAEQYRGRKLIVELANVGTDSSWYQVSDDQGTDGVTISVDNAEITWLSMGSFHSYKTDKEKSDVWYSGSIQPTTSLRLDYVGGTNPGDTLSAEIIMQPTSSDVVQILVVGKLTDRDNWVRTRSEFIDDDSNRFYWAGNYPGVMTLLPERQLNIGVKGYVLPIPSDVEVVEQTITENTVIPGSIVDVNVTLRNNRLEQVVPYFDVKCSYDNVEIGTERIWLAEGEERVVTFTWNTAGIPEGEYMITVMADSSNEIDESNESNNQCTTLLTVRNPNQAPTLNSISGPTSGYRGTAYTWTVTGSDADGDDLTYEWYFDDAYKSSGSSFTYTFGSGDSTGNHMIKVRVADAEEYSDFSTLTFTLNELEKVATPVFSPAGGTHSSSQTVVLSCSTLGATIRYTTDGSEPTSMSTAYSSAILVSSGTVTVKAKAFKAGMTDSDTASATFTISINSPSPKPPDTTEFLPREVVYAAAAIGAVFVIAIVIVVLKKQKK